MLSNGRRVALRNAGQGNAKAVAQPTADRRRGSWLDSKMLRIVAYNEETEGPGLLFDSEINVSVTKQELMAKSLVSAYIRANNTRCSLVLHSATCARLDCEYGQARENSMNHNYIDANKTENIDSNKTVIQRKKTTSTIPTTSST